MTFELETEARIRYNGLMETTYETTNILPDMGFQIDFATMKYNSPPHWHREMEILYVLNGSAVITMEGEKYKMNPLDLIVVESSVIHEVIYELPQTMAICIHISRSYLRRYLNDPEFLRIRCIGTKLQPKQQESYNRLCTYLKDLTILYFEQKASYTLRSSALILLVLAELTDFFSQPVTEHTVAADVSQLSRIEQVFQYVERHFREPVELQDAADELGLNKEYFCRFFKKNTGMSFLQYVSQVRLNHVYQDLLYTEGSIQEILEKNGIYNNKLFYRQFQETYHCTPRELKKMRENNPYL